MPMRAERDKLNAKTLALQLRMTESEYRLQEDEETCRILVVTGGSCTFQRGDASLLVTPGCVLLLGPGGGVFQQAGHLAPELIGCRFPAAVLTELKSVMQRDFSPLFEPDDPILLYGPVQWASRLRTLLNLMRSAAGEPDCPGIIYLSLLLHYVDQ